MSEPNPSSRFVPLINVLGALVAEAEEIAGDESLPELVREFARGVLPVLESMDYASPQHLQTEDGRMLMDAVIQGVPAEEPDTFSAPIWSN